MNQYSRLDLISVSTMQSRRAQIKKNKFLKNIRGQAKVAQQVSSDEDSDHCNDFHDQLKRLSEQATLSILQTDTLVNRQLPSSTSVEIDSPAVQSGSVLRPAPGRAALVALPQSEYNDE